MGVQSRQKRNAKKPLRYKTTDSEPETYRKKKQGHSTSQVKEKVRGKPLPAPPIIKPFMTKSSTSVMGGISCLGVPTQSQCISTDQLSSAIQSSIFAKRQGISVPSAQNLNTRKPAVGSISSQGVQNHQSVPVQMKNFSKTSTQLISLDQASSAATPTAAANITDVTKSSAAVVGGISCLGVPTQSQSNSSDQVHSAISTIFPKRQVISVPFAQDLSTRKPAVGSIFSQGVQNLQSVQMINLSKSSTQPISFHQVSVAGTSTANTTDAAGNVGFEMNLGNNENINSHDEGIELCGESYSNSVSEDASSTCHEENDSLNLNDPDQVDHNNEIAQLYKNTSSKNVMSLVSSTPQKSKRLLDSNASTVKEKKLRGSHSENQIILSKLNQIILTQKNHTILINKLIAHSGMSAPATPRPDGWPIKLPLPDDQAFFARENFLVADTNFDYAVEYFVNSSSNKLFEDTTREILKSLISKQLKRKLNWKGTEKKFGLKQRRTGDVIIEAVRRRHKEANKKKIITTISVWLRNNLTKDKGPEDEEDGSSSGGGGGGQSGEDSDGSQSMGESD